MTARRREVYVPRPQTATTTCRCGREVVASTDDYSVTHAWPPCGDYLLRDPIAFLRWLRGATGAPS